MGGWGTQTTCSLHAQSGCGCGAEGGWEGRGQHKRQVAGGCTHNCSICSGEIHSTSAGAFTAGTEGNITSPPSGDITNPSWIHDGAKMARSGGCQVEQNQVAPAPHPTPTREQGLVAHLICGPRHCQRHHHHHAPTTHCRMRSSR
jgi:hypothetical protein